MLAPLLPGLRAVSRASARRSWDPGVIMEVLNWGTLRFCLVVLLVSVPFPAPVSARHVIGERSAWNESHTRIFTTRIVQHDDGQFEIERIPGGSVDGVRMVQLPLLSL